MRALLVLAIILAVIAVAAFVLARRRTREALAARRRTAELEEQLDVWVDAERRGLARREDPPERDKLEP